MPSPYLAYRHFSPHPDFGHGINAQPGITFRHWLSGMAMANILSANNVDEYTPEGIAQMAVFQADALLAELEKPIE